MKTKILVKYSLALILQIFLLSTVTGQSSWDTLPYKQFADYKLQQLNTSFINSGILYDRVFPVADIERFKQQKYLPKNQVIIPAFIYQKSLLLL